VEWAYLVEPYARPANELLFDRLGIGDGVRLIDIACRSGFAAHLAAERKAQVSVLDAAVRWRVYGVPGFGSSGSHLKVGRTRSTWRCRSGMTEFRTLATIPGGRSALG